MKDEVIYIYDFDLNLIGVADPKRFESSIFTQYYIDCGCILSTSRIDVVEL